MPSPPFKHDSPEMALYLAYPRKVARGAALPAIAKALRRVTEEHGGKQDEALAWLMERVQVYAGKVAKWPVADRRFIPHGSTWFNQERYYDDEECWGRDDTGAKTEDLSWR